VVSATAGPAGGRTSAGRTSAGRATADTPAPAVSLSDLSVTYPGRSSRDTYAAVRGVTFEVGQDEIVGLVGEAGSGKSALLRTVA
jgi:peptide/nickel transport system ATP-binding protein